MQRFLVILLAALSSSTTTASIAAQVGSNPDEYGNRDGEKEAIADLRHGKPLKLYYSWVWGEGLTLPAAGISSCHADGPEDMRKAKSIFVSIPALEYREDHHYTTEENERRLHGSSLAPTI